MKDYYKAFIARVAALYDIAAVYAAVGSAERKQLLVDFVESNKN
jgi:hypothetical protein